VITTATYYGLRVRAGYLCEAHEGHNGHECRGCLWHIIEGLRKEAEWQKNRAISLALNQSTRRR